MSCTAKTYCQSITAFIECIPHLYQGTDYDFQIELYDTDGLPLDLSEYSGIHLHLYTDSYTYGNFKWPYGEDDEDEYILPLEVLQYETTAGQEDIGIIAFNIPSSLSERFLTGSVYAEIKFKKDSKVTGGSPTYHTIGCLNIGTVRESLTKSIKF